MSKRPRDADASKAPKLYTLTDYPDIYKHTYWGNHTLIAASDYRVIANRNAFIRQFPGIKVHGNWTSTKTKADWRQKTSHYDINTNTIAKVFDHVEYYKTDERLITICSPYTDYMKEQELIDFYKEVEDKYRLYPIADMYMCSRCSTFMVLDDINSKGPGEPLWSRHKLPSMFH